MSVPQREPSIRELAERVAMLYVENQRLIAVLQRIADGHPPPDDCTCGHKPEFCHKRNANRWCGGFESWTIWHARAGLEPPDPLPVCGEKENQT